MDSTEVSTANCQVLSDGETKARSGDKENRAFTEEKTLGDQDRLAVWHSRSSCFIHKIKYK
jgi:hypothetical protein